MKRHGFTMKLKPGCAAEYRRRHDAIWPELVKAHRDAGISDYSIFIDEPTLTLFAFRKLSDDETTAAMPELDIVRKWWAWNADLMESNSDNSPVFTELVEVFHMD